MNKTRTYIGRDGMEHEEIIYEDTQHLFQESISTPQTPEIFRSPILKSPLAGIMTGMEPEPSMVEHADREAMFNKAKSAQNELINEVTAQLQNTLKLEDTENAEEAFGFGVSLTPI